MGRAPCCDKASVKKGPWSPEEDAKLKEYMDKHGTGGNWIALPTKAGLKRCGKSCRLRWLNYLRPNIKHGEFSEDEDRIICCLFASIGSRWSIMASHLPGRTDNDIKNHWNTKLKKNMGMGLEYPSSQLNNKPHQFALLPMLQNSTQPPSLTQVQMFNNNNSSNSNNNSCYYHPLVNGNSSNFLQSQQEEENFMGTLQNYQVEDGVFMSNLVKESEIGYCGYDGTTFVDNIGAHNNNNYLYGGVEEIKQGSVNLGENALLDYGVEEIEVLMSNTSSCINNFFWLDENKIEERVM